MNGCYLITDNISYKNTLGTIAQKDAKITLIEVRHIKL